MHLKNNTPLFSFEVDRGKLNYLDDGTYKFQVILYDAHAVTPNFKSIGMDIDYIDIEEKKVFALDVIWLQDLIK